MIEMSPLDIWSPYMLLACLTLRLKMLIYKCCLIRVTIWVYCSFENDDSHFRGGRHLERIKRPFLPLVHLSAIFYSQMPLFVTIFKNVPSLVGRKLIALMNALWSVDHRKRSFCFSQPLQPEMRENIAYIITGSKYFISTLYPFFIIEKLIKAHIKSSKRFRAQSKL